MRIARGLLAGGLALLAGHGCFLVLDGLFPFPEQGLERYGRSPVVSAADGTPMRVGLTPGEERLWPVTLEEVSPHVVHALLAQEDRRFFTHAGVDLPALARAFLENLRSGGARQGASTITMQLARLADPRPRTLTGKLVQSFRALQLERRLAKPDLLERYLNLVPFGGNLRGIRAAAHAWFGKRPGDLAAVEAALLVSVLPSPTRYSPRRDPGGALRRRNRILLTMREQGHLDGAGLRAALRMPLGLRPTSFPDLAPHAWLRSDGGHTTIDPSAQRAVEAVAARAGPGVDGLAIVVIENETRAVRALVGARRPAASLLDASGRPRSAGSTLKPFLYALAFDLGLAAPATPLLDLPWAARDWRPGNFDRAFRGPVPAARALADSLNLPAIRLAAMLPEAAFSDLLHRIGFDHVRAANAGPDIDLAIGTDDVTPLELAGAYAALAGGGVYEAPWLEERTGIERRVLSRGAAALVTQALADPTRPRPPGAPARGVAWKTGTSSRRRDAWAAGFTRRFTAVVWSGRLDGRPDSSLVGSRNATPLLFEVLQALDSDPAAFPEPEGVIAILVCAETGLAPTRACPRTRLDRAPGHAGALRTCSVHLHGVVDGTTGHLLCVNCRSGRDAVERDLAVYPPVLARWRRAVGLPVAPLPEHEPGCTAPVEPGAARPVFLAPRPGQVFGAPSGRAHVVVQALAMRPAANLRLLVDGEPRASVRSGSEIALDLPFGRHRITALSTPSRWSTVEILVRPEE